MPYRFAGRRRDRVGPSIGAGVVGLLACLLLSHPAWAEDLTPVIVAPTQSVTAGEPLRIWLAVLNTSDHPASYVFPPALEGRLRVGDTERPVSVALRNPTDAGPTVVPPGGYARKEYSLTVPEGLTGRVVLSVPSLAASPVALAVAQAIVEAKTPEMPPGDAAKASDRPVEASAETAEESPAARFFKEHVSGYEPFYFVVGPEYPAARFQISFKYQVFSNEGFAARMFPPVKGLHVAYTQTSLWDLDSTSKPFVDTSYKPEVFYVAQRVDGGRWADRLRLDLQAGLQHESNGKAGADSRSLNLAYIEPTLRVGAAEGFQVSLAPRVWTYLGGLDENPDLDRYRGHVGLRSTLGWAKGAQLAVTGRVGDDLDRGSLQLDLSYPLMGFRYGSVGLYLYAQYFLGYGESLLRYNERSSVVRFGIALFR